MTRGAIEPERTPVSADEYTENHPAYALVEVNRVSTMAPFRGPTAGRNPGEALYGSDFGHRTYIMVTVRPSQMRRGLSSDYYGQMSEPDYIQFAMSEAQWATFVSSFGIGGGTPATVQWLNGTPVPAIVPIDNRRAQFNDEVGATFADALKRLDEVEQYVTTKKGKEALRLARQELEANLPFVAKQFDKHAENTIEKAKVEVAGYIQGALQRAGVAALSGGAPPITLIEAGAVEGEFKEVE